MTDLTLWLVETDTGESSLCLGRDAAEDMSLQLVASPDVLSVECTPLSPGAHEDGVVPYVDAPGVADEVLRLGLAAGLDIEEERFDWSAVLAVLRDPVLLAQTLADEDTSEDPCTDHGHEECPDCGDAGVAVGREGLLLLHAVSEPVGPMLATEV